MREETPIQEALRRINVDDRMWLYGHKSFNLAVQSGNAAEVTAEAGRLLDLRANPTLDARCPWCGAHAVANATAKWSAARQKFELCEVLDGFMCSECEWGGLVPLLVPLHAKLGKCTICDDIVSQPDWCTHLRTHNPHFVDGDPEDVAKSFGEVDYYPGDQDEY